MSAFRFIHAADLHLDSPFVGLSGLPDSIKRTIRESTFDALNRMIALARQSDVDFVLIGGDLYDAKDRSLRAQLRFMQAMEQLHEANIPVYIVHGNHDPTEGKQAGLTWPNNVTVFSSDRVEEAIVPNRNGDAIARVRGMSYKTSAMQESLLPYFNPVAAPSNLYEIGLLHCNVDGNKDHDNYSPCRTSELVQKGYDYWAPGHVHEHRIVHQHPWIVYPGNTQGRHIREQGERGCCLVHVDEWRNTEVVFHSLESVRFHELVLDISRWQNEQDVVDAVMNEVEHIRKAIVQANRAGAILRIVFTGRGRTERLLKQHSFTEELLAEIQENERWRLNEERDGWVWVTSFRFHRDFERAASFASDSFLADIADIAERLMNDEEELTQFIDEAMQPLFTNRIVSRHVREQLLQQRHALFEQAYHLGLSLLQSEEVWEDSE